MTLFNNTFLPESSSMADSEDLFLDNACKMSDLKFVVCGCLSNSASPLALSALPKNVAFEPRIKLGFSLFNDCTADGLSPVTTFAATNCSAETNFVGAGLGNSFFSSLMMETSTSKPSSTSSGVNSGDISITSASITVFSGKILPLSSLVIFSFGSSSD